MYNIWIDDERPMPDGFNVHITNSEDAIKFINQNWMNIDKISLDHDLGLDSGTGYDICCWIERQVLELNRICHFVFQVHTANPVGRGNMLRSIYKIYGL